MCGITLKAIWWAKYFGVRVSPRAHASVWARRSSTPFTPAPDTARNEVGITRFSRPVSWRGLSGITVTMVVQFGHATMPLCPATACALISGTTSGTAGSMRKALGLSTTLAPAFTGRRAESFRLGGARGEERHLHALEALGTDLLHPEAVAREGHRLPHRPLGGEHPPAAHRNLPLPQEAERGLAARARHPHHRDGEAGGHLVAPLDLSADEIAHLLGAQGLFGRPAEVGGAGGP